MHERKYLMDYNFVSKICEINSLFILSYNYSCDDSCSTLKRFLKDHNLRRHDTLSVDDVLKAVEVSVVVVFVRVLS